MEEIICREDTKTMSSTSVRLVPGQDKREIRQAKTVNRLLEALDRAAAATADRLTGEMPASRLLYTVRYGTLEGGCTLSVTLVQRIPGMPSRHKAIEYTFRDGGLCKERVIS